MEEFIAKVSPLQFIHKFGQLELQILSINFKIIAWLVPFGVTYHDLNLP
jgi:hypothetical protein